MTTSPKNRDVRILVRAVGPKHAMITVPIALDYLRGSPIEDVLLTRAEALELAGELIGAIRRSERGATP